MWFLAFLTIFGTIWKRLVMFVYKITISIFPLIQIIIEGVMKAKRTTSVKFVIKPLQDGVDYKNIFLLFIKAKKISNVRNVTLLLENPKSWSNTLKLFIIVHINVTNVENVSVLHSNLIIIRDIHMLHHYFLGFFKRA